MLKRAKSLVLDLTLHHRFLNMTGQGQRPKEILFREVLFIRQFLPDHRIPFTMKTGRYLIIGLPELHHIFRTLCILPVN